MNKFQFDKNTKSLFEAIASLESTKEMEKFFRDLCTPEEIKAMSERWLIAKMLNDGLSYRKIAELSGASTTTVGRVATWLNNGEGGYLLTLSRTSHRSSSLISRKS